MPDEVRIYRTADREIHRRLGSPDVAVCWNLAKHSTLEQRDGMEIHTTRYTRHGAPYIAFVWLRRNPDDGSWYEDEDSPVHGGLSLEEATRLREELAWAITYLPTMEEDPS